MAGSVRRTHTALATTELITALTTNYGYDEQAMGPDSDRDAWPLSHTRVWFRGLDADDQRALLQSTWQAVLVPLAEEAMAWATKTSKSRYRYMIEAADDAARLAAMNLLFAVWDADDDVAYDFIRDDTREHFGSTLYWTGRTRLTHDLWHDKLSPMREDKEKRHAASS